MSLLRWLASTALAVLPLAVIAEDKPTQHPDPANPDAVVPQPVYVSAFDGYQTYAEPEESPTKSWHAANDEIGRAGSPMSDVPNTPMNTDTPAHDMHHKHGEK
jgi:hypothetical protein